MRKTLLVSTMVVMACGAAIAQDEDGKKMRMHRDGDHMRQMMKGVDANKDGVITREEVEAAKKARFAEIDADGNGALSMDEMKAHHEAMKAEREAKKAERREKMAERRGKMEGKKQSRESEHFAKMDTDGDGAIKFEEFGRHDEEDMFSRLDTDGDGRITEEERKAGHKKMRKHKEKMEKHD